MKSSPSPCLLWRGAVFFKHTITSVKGIPGTKRMVATTRVIPPPGRPPGRLPVGCQGAHAADSAAESGSGSISTSTVRRVFTQSRFHRPVAYFRKALIRGCA